MGNCKFANELNRLCKSSSDSIDNTEKFDDFKKYMHVTRTAEEDLKAILRNVNAGNKKDVSAFVWKCRRWKVSFVVIPEKF